MNNFAHMIKLFSVKRIFLNNMRSFILGACCYSFFMFLLWVNTLSSSVLTAEPFYAIADIMGQSTGRGTIYHVLNYPFGAHGPIPLPIHYLMWILWGGILGAAFGRFAYRIYVYIIKPTQKKVMSISHSGFLQYLYMGMFWGTIGSLLSFSINPLFLFFTWVYIWLSQGYIAHDQTVKLGYGVISVYLLSAVLSGAIYGIIGFYFFRSKLTDRCAQK